MVHESIPALRGANITVLRGRLSRPIEERLLPSGERVAELELRVPPHDRADKAETVNVVWPGAPTGVAQFGVDDDVVVVGRVRRRFFRSGGSTQSRTEVVADAVCPVRRSRTLATVLEAATQRVAAVR